MLGKCEALADLRLGGNRLRAKGGERLAKGLAECTALRRLNLWGNSLEDEVRCATSLRALYAESGTDGLYGDSRE